MDTPLLEPWNLEVSSNWSISMIQCSYQLIKDIIGGKSQIFYLLPLKFSYWKTSEYCFFSESMYSISILSCTWNLDQGKLNMLSVRITSAQKLYGDKYMPYIISFLMTLPAVFCLCLRTQSISLCYRFFLKIFSLVSVKAMLAKNLYWRSGSRLTAQWTKPKYCIWRQEYENLGEL